MTFKESRLYQVNGHYKPTNYRIPLEDWERPITRSPRISERTRNESLDALVFRYLFLPLWVIARVRRAGTLLWNVNRPYRDPRDVVVTPAPTAAEAVRYEREVAAMMRRLGWGVIVHGVAASVVAILVGISSTASSLLAIAWFLTSLIAWYRFDKAADRLVADIRTLHAEHHAQDRDRFPYGQQSERFPRVRS